MNSPSKECSDVEDGEEDRKMKKDKVLMESREVEIAQFMCPYHACHTCTPSDMVSTFSASLSPTFTSSSTPLSAPLMVLFIFYYLRLLVIVVMFLVAV